MRFEDSGLQDSELVEDAFNYAQAYTRSLSKETLLDHKELVDDSYNDDMAMLEEDFENGEVTEEQYLEEKADLERLYEEDLEEMAHTDINSELSMMFRDNNLSLALEIQNHSEKASPALIAAALLADCARDPVDCKKIEKKFGKAIAGLIAEKLHVEAYPSERSENLAAASRDAKRLFMAELANIFQNAASDAKKLGPNEKAVLPQQEVETAFADAKLLWGNDKKLDKHLVTVFNSAAQALSSPFSIEANEKGTLLLIKNTRTEPEKKRRGKKPINPGDEGF